MDFFVIVEHILLLIGAQYDNGCDLKGLKRNVLFQLDFKLRMFF